MIVTYRTMNLHAKAEFIQKTLDSLLPSPPIPLDHKDPFTLLVAVLLSAQCTDAVVNQATPALFAAADTPAAMAALGSERILGFVKRCGLAPTKSRNIQALSEILLAEHGGHVPCDMEALERLPGVGHKTASVVLSHAFKIPAFPVDTHIHRLAWRWGLSDGTSVAQTERSLKRLFSPENWEKLHLQIIYFGRQYCPARNHDPAQCPICSVIGVKGRKESSIRA